jgi:hypothetical protein
MISIIGLFNDEDDAARSIRKLKDAGIPEDKISIITQENAIRRMLGCKPACVVRRYAAWGVSIGIAIYATLGLFAGIGRCNLLHFGHAYGIGTFVGGVMGCLVGTAEYEKDSHLHVQGARMGDRVVATIQASEENAENVKLILGQGKALSVKAL